MTFDPNVPNPAQSPGLFPPQNSANFSRLKTIINADHVFNDTAQDNDGFHRQCSMVVRAQPVGLPTGANSILYSWLDTFGQSQLRFYNGNRDIRLTPCEIVAAASFNGSVAGNNALQTPRSYFNVSSVTRIGTTAGLYLITFLNDVGTNQYIVQITGKGEGSSGVVCGAVRGDVSYATAVTNTTLMVAFANNTGGRIDVTMGNVTVMRV